MLDGYDIGINMDLNRHRHLFGWSIQRRSFKFHNVDTRKNRGMSK